MAGAKKRKTAAIRPGQDKYYNNGNVAYQVQAEPAYEPEERVVPQKKPDILIRRKLAEERKAFFVHRIKLVFSFGVLFCGCIVTMASYANVAKQKVSLNALKEELIVMQSDNNALQADIAKQVDLKYIEQEAVTRLGMSEPQAYQIFYIDVPKQSYTVQRDKQLEQEESGQNFWDNIFNFLKKD